MRRTLTFFAWRAGNGAIHLKRLAQAPQPNVHPAQPRWRRSPTSGSLPPLLRWRRAANWFAPSRLVCIPREQVGDDHIKRPSPGKDAAGKDFTFNTATQRRTGWLSLPGQTSAANFRTARPKAPAVIIQFTFVCGVNAESSNVLSRLSYKHASVLTASDAGLPAEFIGIKYWAVFPDDQNRGQRLSARLYSTAYSICSAHAAAVSPTTK